MPDYQSLIEILTIHQIAAPSQSQLVGYKAEDLMWFEERVEPSPKNSNSSGQSSNLPANRYALLKTESGAQLIYSEQWLSSSYCLTLQPITAAQKKLIEQGQILSDVDANKAVP
jgi:hypothetical protein